MISIDLSGKTILVTGTLSAMAGRMPRRLAASGATLITDIKASHASSRPLRGSGLRA
jgi:NAD(P)-dependent dehydrogenase (short-subunit alcohol dehydrogenase family)